MENDSLDDVDHIIVDGFSLHKIVQNDNETLVDATVKYGNYLKHNFILQLFITNNGEWISPTKPVG